MVVVGAGVVVVVVSTTVDEVGVGCTVVVGAGTVEATGEVGTDSAGATRSLSWLATASDTPTTAATAAAAQMSGRHAGLPPRRHSRFRFLASSSSKPRRGTASSPTT